MSNLVIKTFTATRHEDRMNLGDVVTTWLRKETGFNVSEIRTLQSSDQSYHCLSIVVLGTYASGHPQPPPPTRVPGPGVRRG